MNLLLRNVTLLGAAGVHEVEVSGDRISRVAPVTVARVATGDVETIDCGGATALAGLHDHHIHLLAAAESLRSVPCGPPAVNTREELHTVLAHATPRADGWIRGTGYHESVGGPLDRRELDSFRPDQPVRVQHVSGAAWFVNTVGWEQLGRPDGDGVFHRGDDVLRRRWGGAPPDLRGLGVMLAGHGVCGVTDATPHNGPSERALFDEARARGDLRVGVTMMGGDDLPSGPRKIVLSDHDLMGLDELTSIIERAHGDDRTVAIHSVTRTSLALAVAALDAVGADRRDRIEHASVAPPDLADRVGRLGVTVVTQPNFVVERGDRYRREVDADDQAWLYRCRGLLGKGVPLAGGTDAPFGDTNPWLAIRAAIDRRTASGAVLGEAEALEPDRALALFLGPAHDPGGPPRRLAAGGPADVCVLRAQWRDLRADVPLDPVALTLTRGVVTHR